MQRFSPQIPDKNCAIKRGLERKNRAIKKSRYVCQGTNLLSDKTECERIYDQCTVSTVSCKLDSYPHG